MSLSILPAVAILLVVFFTSPNNIEHNGKKKTIYKSNYQSESNYPVQHEHDPDYKAIFNYITSIYKKIKKEDAKIIADNLVKMGKKHNIDPKLAAAVIARESAFNRKAISSTGAKGLGQIKDFNYKSLNIKDPFDIRQNISGTVKYLKEMIGNWKDNSDKTSLALASYYKGYGAVKKDNGAFDRDTKNYVDDILKYYNKLTNLSEKY